MYKYYRPLSFNKNLPFWKMVKSKDYSRWHMGGLLANRRSLFNLQIFKYYPLEATCKPQPTESINKKTFLFFLDNLTQNLLFIKISIDIYLLCTRKTSTSLWFSSKASKSLLKQIKSQEPHFHLACVQWRHKKQTKEQQSSCFAGLTNVPPFKPSFTSHKDEPEKKQKGHCHQHLGQEPLLLVLLCPRSWKKNQDNETKNHISIQQQGNLEE